MLRLVTTYPTTTTGVGFARRLAAHGDRLAVVAGDTSLTYAQLAERVEQRAAELGGQRRLVLVAGANEVEPLVTYLAGLAGGHAVLLAPGEPDRVAALVTAWDPDVVAGPAADGGWGLAERRPGTAHTLHPDLALLLTTSGSTGSPRLVRLSSRNLEANAAAIADYLGIREDDRAVTTLPLHYCYGLSVVNSHLERGAALALTDLSVVDACFWDLARRHGCTSLAGVPYTFELLERVGFAEVELPSLRYVTQAGGRMPPERVRAVAELGRRKGFDLVVMYGQTEATARMAYLPPDLAASRPEAVGVPIPGGTLRIDPLDDEGDGSGTSDGVGELVYSGPNVMLGYAETPADLALGATLAELRTGDLARQADDGLYEVVGRRSRIAKLFGLRIDLQHLESVLARAGLPTVCAATDDALVVAVEGSGTGRAERARRVAAETCGVPARAVRVRCVDRLPRLPNGKPDLQAVRALATDPSGGVERSSPTSAGSPVDLLRGLYADVLDRPDVGSDESFVSLGGDSLSYVELSLRLEDVLGRLPSSWHTRSIDELAAGPVGRWAAGRDATGGDADGPRRRGLIGLPAPGLPVLSPWPRMDASIALRAVAILLIVGSHANVYVLEGGAHVLLAVAGYNLARFHLTTADRIGRRRGLLRTLARIAVPSLAWIGAWFVLTDSYSVSNLVFLTSLIGPDVLGPPWEYWFLEVLAQTLLLLAVLVGVPAFDRWERRRPFGVAAGLVGLALLPRLGAVDLGPGPDAIQSAPAVLWLVALGWATARATSVPQRLAVTAAAALAVPGFFDDPRREAIVLAGVVLLVWVRTIRLPRLLRAGAGVLASSSLYIYLTHWQVFPHLQDSSPLGALAASVAVGVVSARVAGAVLSRVERRAAARRRARQRVTERVAVPAARCTA